MTEWKKMFRSRRVFVFGIFSLLYFLFFIILRFGPLEGSHNLKSSMEYPAYSYVLHTAGRTVDEADYQKIKEESKRSQTPVFDEWVQNQKLLKDYQIDTYEEFNIFISDFSLEHPELAGPLLEDFYAKFRDSEIEQAMEEVNYSYVLQDIVERYETYGNSHSRDFLPQKVVKYTKEILRALSIWMVLGVVLFAIPYFVEDNQANIAKLQYSIQSEKKIKRKKLKTVLGTGLLLCGIETGCVMLYLLCSGYFAFVGSSMNSFACIPQTFDNLSYGTYLLLSGAAGTLAALVSGAAVSVFTGGTKLYTNAVLNNIPVIAAVIGCICFLSS